jgi:hypothetical protein
MNTKLLLCLVPFCLFSLRLTSQILNIDNIDTSAYVRKAKVSLNINSGLEIDKQKNNLYDATNTLEMMWQQYKELFIVAGSYRFTYNGPDDILNAGYIHVRYRHDYKNKIQPEVFFQYNWDSDRGIIYRILGGANIRYNLFRGDRFDFNAGLGLMHEDEKWNYNGVDSSKIPVNTAPVTESHWKINSYVRLDWKPNGNNDVTFNIFLQTRPDRFELRIAPSAQWNIKAGRHVSFSISLSSLYDTAPVVPIDKFYYSLSYTLLFKL